MKLNTKLTLKNTTNHDLLNSMSDNALATYAMLQHSTISVALDVPITGNIPRSKSVKNSLIELSKLGLINLS